MADLKVGDVVTVTIETATVTEVWETDAALRLATAEESVKLGVVVPTNLPSVKFQINTRTWFVDGTQISLHHDETDYWAYRQLVGDVEAVKRAGATYRVFAVDALLNEMPTPIGYVIRFDREGSDPIHMAWRQHNAPGLGVHRTYHPGNVGMADALSELLDAQGVDAAVRAFTEAAF